MYFLTKADIISLSTLVFNEETIIGTIDILQTIINWLGLIDEIVSNKVIIIYGDLLEVKNAKQTIFQ